MHTIWPCMLTHIHLVPYGYHVCYVGHIVSTQISDLYRITVRFVKLPHCTLELWRSATNVQLNQVLVEQAISHDNILQVVR